MKKLLILIDNFGYGGLQKTGYFLANSFADQGVEVHFCALSESEQVREINKMIRVCNLGFVQKKGALGKLYQILRAAIKFRKQIKNANIDTVVVLGDIMLLVAQLGTPRRVRIVGSERNSPERYSSRWKKIMDCLYSKCDTVVFQTEGAMKCYSQKVQKHGVIIPNPLFGSGSTKTRQVEADYICTAAARFEYKKGIDVLIRAFSEVKKEYPLLKLKIVGDGELKQSYIELAQSLGLCDEDIVFTGLVPNVVDEIYDAKMFILPSRFEGIPNVMMEAMGAGIPVIASDCSPGGPRMLTENGRCGLLFKTDDADELSEKIKYLLSDEGIRQELSKLEIIRMKEFEPGKIAQRWMNAVMR